MSFSMDLFLRWIIFSELLSRLRCCCCCCWPAPRCGGPTAAACGRNGFDASARPKEPRALVEAVRLRPEASGALKLWAGARSEAKALPLQTALSSSELRVDSLEMRCSVDSMRYLSREPECPLRRLGVPGMVALLRSFSLSSSCGSAGCGSGPAQRRLRGLCGACSCLRLLLDIFRRLMRYFFFSDGCSGFEGLAGRSLRVMNS